VSAGQWPSDGPLVFCATCGRTLQTAQFLDEVGGIVRANAMGREHVWSE